MFKRIILVIGITLLIVAIVLIELLIEKVIVMQPYLPIFVLMLSCICFSIFNMYRKVNKEEEQQVGERTMDTTER